MHSRSLVLQAKTLFALLLLTTYFISVSSSVSAHEFRPSIVNISIDESGKFKMSILTNLEAMIAQISTDHDDTADSENSTRYDALRRMPFNVLIKEFSDYEPTLVSNIKFNINDKKQALTIDNVEIPAIGDLDLARDSVINFVGTMPENTKTLTWQWDKSLGSAVLRVSSHENEDVHSSYLIEGKASDSIVIEGLAQPKK